jgi:hypothetical protein
MFVMSTALRAKFITRSRMISVLYVVVRFAPCQSVITHKATSVPRLDFLGAVTGLIGP